MEENFGEANPSLTPNDLAKINAEAAKIAMQRDWLPDGVLTTTESEKAKIDQVG
ncbi:hypothetical protein [Yoonia maritima]|uniref:hypothetical protein n=1 Tax=Yoonia maritima TaxID=1435347 RepID=UPI0013A60C00|nr:hypothetical protein [Yoonia maritima]